MQTFSGIVQRGTKRAAALGFPTVNIPLENADIAGIYVARVTVRGTAYPSAAFADQERKVLEAHILDQKLDLYGEKITIELLEKIRDNQKFEDDESLRAAIAEDVRKVQRYFKRI